MKTITLRGVDDELAAALKEHAQGAASSVNQFVLDQLRSDLGMKKTPRFTCTHHDLDGLFGCWDEDEYARMEEKLTAQRGIDEELWR